MPSKLGSNDRGLGWSHQKRRVALLRAHIDGTPCPCIPGCGKSCICVGTQGLPMYKDPLKNPDGQPLEADHTLARAEGGTRADRLMLSTCNRSRGGVLGRSMQMEFTVVRTSREW